MKIIVSLLVMLILSGCSTPNDFSQKVTIDVVKGMNAKAPDWFTQPVASNKTYAYGTGNTYEDALKKARANLAETIHSKISVTSDTAQKVTTDSSYTDYSRNISTSTSVELTGDDCTVYRQDEVDGKYYVALTLKEKR
jgi:hypothetical protein